MNDTKKLHLSAEKSQLEDLIAHLGPTELLDRASLEHRLSQVNKLLSELPEPAENAEKIMGWRYQFLKYGEGEDEYIELHEVYYENGKPAYHCRASVGGHSVESIQWVVEQIQKAYELPFLTEEDFKR
jgi:hypothetical protein